MAKVIPLTTVITVVISVFGVESAWVPNLVKRINFENAQSGSSNQDSQAPSTSSNNNSNSSKAAASPTSKDSTATSTSANFSNASSKSASASSPSDSASVQPSSVNPTMSATSTYPLTSSAESSPVTNTIASPTSNESTISDQESSKSSSSSGAIGAVVAMAIIIVIGAVAYLIVRRKKAKQNRVKMVEKSDPFTMGYGNHDPLPYKEMNNTSMAHNAYSTNESYTNEATSIHQPPISSTQMNFTGITPPDSTAVFSQQALPTSVTNSYNTNTPPTFSTFSQPSQVPTVPAAFDGNSAPMIRSLPQSNSSNLYAVIATYIPTLSDELEMEMGDQIELIEEFDDGWCQGTNVTKGGTTGVFPRHCIDRVASSNNNPMDVERTKRVSSIRIQ